MSALLAVAVLTWRAVWRLRVGWLLVALIAIVLAMPYGPGGAAVRLLGVLGPGQTLLVVAALWLAADLASREFEAQTILALAVRPLAPMTVLCGRWLGLLACELPLLAVLGLGVARQVGPGPDGWRWAGPEVPDFVAEAERRMAAAGESEAWPDPVARETFRRRRIGALRAAWQTLPPGASRTWMIRAVAGTDGLTLVLLPRSGEAAQPLAARLWLGPPGQPGPAMPLRLRPGQPLEIDLAGLPGSPGGLSVRLVNDAETALVFPPEDGVRLRWRETGFAGNLARALAVIAGQLALLTALGLLLGSTLSFPVAAFCGLAYLAAAGLIGLVAQRLQHQVLFLGRQALEQPWLERVSQVALQTGYGLTAVLNSVRPVASLAEGQAIALAQVRAIGLGAGLGGSLLLLWLAGWLLRRRELGGLVA